MTKSKKFCLVWFLWSELLNTKTTANSAFFLWPARKFPGNFVDHAFKGTLPPITRKKLPSIRGTLFLSQDRKNPFFEWNQKSCTIPFSA
jgi:hypothetical protein